MNLFMAGEQEWLASIQLSLPYFCRYNKVEDQNVVILFIWKRSLMATIINLINSKDV